MLKIFEVICDKLDIVFIYQYTEKWVFNLILDILCSISCKCDSIDSVPEIQNSKRSASQFLHKNSTTSCCKSLPLFK